MFLTMAEVCCDACLHDTCHVSHWCKATGAGCEKRQNRKAPPLSVQPGNDMSSKRFTRWNAHSVEQSQRVTEETAEGHVPLLQTHLCKGKRRKWYDWREQRIYFLWLMMLMRKAVRKIYLVGWMWQRSPEVSPAEPPGWWGWCYLLVPVSPVTAHTSIHRLRPWVSPPDRKRITGNPCK